MQGNVNIPDSTITSALTFRNLVLMNMQQLTNFPYIEKDFDALTDYELLCLVVKFLNDVIANQNEQNNSITNLYNAFLDLQTYVNNTKDTLENAFNALDDYVRNYFANLDVQEEINNKLDDMIEDGSLASIIENVIGGYVNVKSLGAKGDGITDDTETIQEIIDNNPNKTIYFPDGVYLISSHLETPANNDASVNLELANNAVIKASDSYDDENPMICLGFKDYDDYHLYENFASFGISGGTIDCNSITGGVSLQNCIRPYVKNITIDNVETVGLALVSGANNNSLDATVENITIICSNNTSAIAVKLTSHDSVLNNIRTFSGKYGFYFDYAGGNHLTETHALALSRDYDTNYQDMCAYYFKSGGGNYNYLTRPYSDGYATAFYFDGQHNNFIRDAYVFYWNEEDESNHVGFNFSSTMTGRISNVHFRFPALGTNTMLKVNNKNNPKGWIKDITVHNTDNLNDANELAYDPRFNLDTKTNLVYNKKIVLIGDSYLEGYTPDGNVTSWGANLQTYLGLTNSQVITSYLGGSSFGGSYPFTNLVTALSFDASVTDVIVAGGYNDRSFNATNIYNGMSAFKTACAEKFPNAKVWCAMIGWTTASDQIYNLCGTVNNYQRAASRLDIAFMGNCEYSLKDYFTMFSSDGIHPNATGQESIGRNIANAFLNGKADVFHPYKTATFTPSGSCSGLNTGSSSIAVEINNNVAQITQQGVIDYAISSISYSATGKNDIEVGTLTAGYVVGNNYKMLSCPVELIVHDTTAGKYFKESGILIFRNGKIYISFGDVTDAGDNYRSFSSINQIQCLPFSCSFDSLMC